jgi:hypothetical protein
VKNQRCIVLIRVIPSKHYDRVQSAITKLRIVMTTDADRTRSAPTLPKPFLRPVVYTLESQDAPNLTVVICIRAGNCLAMLGAFAKWRKAPISFLMSICLSIGPQASERFPPDGLQLTLIFRAFMNICRKNPNLVKIWKNIGHISLMLTAKLNRHKSTLFE